MPQARCEICGRHFESTDQKFLGEHLCPEQCRPMIETALIELIPKGFTAHQVIAMVVREYTRQQNMTREEIRKFLERMKK